MSIKVMSAVWQQSKATGGDLLILLAIADFTNDAGLAFPAIPTLAKKARLSKRQTQRTLTRLQHLGELQVMKNRGPSGTNLYRVMTGDNMSPLVTSATSRGDIYDRRGVTWVSPNPSEEEPSEENQEKIPSDCQSLGTHASVSRIQTIEEEFEEFWAAYPYHRKRAEAECAFREARTLATWATIQAGLARAITSLEWERTNVDGWRYVPHAVNWLMDQGWENDYQEPASRQSQRRIRPDPLDEMIAVHRAKLQKSGVMR